MLTGLKFVLCTACISVVLGMSVGAAEAAERDSKAPCPVTWGNLKQALNRAAADDKTGLDNDFWAVVVNREGAVCSVAFSGRTVGSQWLLSRQIAAAKAFTANGLSLDGKPISTGALYSFVLPIVPPDDPSGNPLYGLHGGNVLDASAAYEGSYNRFGTPRDPMVDQRIGGTITFGGGLGLYKSNIAVGGIGLSGDTACADHSTAWRVRDFLKLTPSVDSLGFDRITLAADAHPPCPNSVGTQGAN